MMETKLVLLGTGTPNACPNASGPSSAVLALSVRRRKHTNRELMPCARTG